MDSYCDYSNAGRVRSNYVGCELRGIRLHNLAPECQKLDLCNSHPAARISINSTGCSRGESVKGTGQNHPLTQQRIPAS